MSKIINVIENLSNLISLKPASDISIKNAEKELKLNFSEEYKTYLTMYGAILAEGVELTGIAKSEHRDVVKVTMQGWFLNNTVPRNLYVVEDTRIDGIMIWQDEKGKIYESHPNKKVEKIFDSLSDYLQTK